MTVKAKTEYIARRYHRLRDNATNTEIRLRGLYTRIGAEGADAEMLLQIYQALVNSRNQFDHPDIGIPTEAADIKAFNDYAQDLEGDVTYNAVTEMTAFRDALNTAVTDMETELPLLTTSFPSGHAIVTTVRNILQAANALIS